MPNKDRQRHTVAHAHSSSVRDFLCNTSGDASKQRTTPVGTESGIPDQCLSWAGRGALAALFMFSKCYRY